MSTDIGVVILSGALLLLGVLIGSGSSYLYSASAAGHLIEVHAHFVTGQYIAAAKAAGHLLSDGIVG